MYSDRYIPSRSGSHLENGYSLLDESPRKRRWVPRAARRTISPLFSNSAKLISPVLTQPPCAAAAPAVTATTAVASALPPVATPAVARRRQRMGHPRCPCC